MNDLTLIAYRNAIEDLARASSGAERSAIVGALASKVSRSRNTVYTTLRKLGWSSGRTVRSDKGRSAVSEAGLRQVSQMVAQARNKRGEPNLPVTEAHRIAQDLDHEAAQLSYRQLQRRLAQTGLSLRHMRAPEASIHRVSTHPNHVWFFDISQAVQWYFRDPESGRKLDLYPDAGARFYKLEQVKRVRKTIHRFLAVDHTTGAYFVQYYYVGGERAEDVVDFLYQAMAPKGLNGAYPFRGVPRRMVMDLGSANRSALVVNLMQELDVEHEFHVAGNAKASGAVETRHNHWQRSFEGRLAQKFAGDLEELNRLATLHCALFQRDSRRLHSRHNQPTMDAWCRITPEQLVECPSRELFFQLASKSPRTGTLNAQHVLRADSRKWEIRGEHVHGRQKVTYRLAPFTEVGIRVWDAHGRELAATELGADAWGFATGGRRHVWDDEDQAGSTAPPTPAQHIANAVADKSKRVEVSGLFDDLEDRLARQAYLTTRGREWVPKAESPVAAEPVTGELDCREEVRERLGGLDRQGWQWWADRIGDGLTRSELDAAFEAWAQQGQNERTTTARSG